MEILSSSVVGTATTDAWSQAYAVHVDGQFLGLVVSTHAPIVATAERGKEILDACVERVSGGVSRDVFLSLFSKCTDSGIDIAAIFLSDQNALVYAQGDVRIQLKRGGKSQVIMAGESVGKYSQGPAVLEDYYVVATTHFLEKFPNIDTSLHPQDQREAYSARLHGDAQAGRMSAVFLELPRRYESVAAAAPLKQPIHVRPSMKLPKLSSKGKKYLRFLVIALVGIMVLLLLGWYVTMRRAQATAKVLSPYVARYSALVALSADKKVDELGGLRDLARDLSVQKKDTKDSALSREIDKLLTQVNNTFTSVSHEQHIDKLHVFYDFRLVAADFVASSVAYDIPGKLAVFLDSQHARLLSVSLEKKEALTLTVDEKLKNPLALAVDNRNAYVLGSEGVMQLSLPLDVMGSVVVNKDLTWAAPKFIDAFGSNVYILDAGARNILKYDLQSPDASPSGWLKNKLGLDFDSVTSVRIDGGVWLGTGTGKILHFMQGSPNSFAYQGVLDVPTSPVYIYTSQDSQKLYVLEPHAARLLVLGKDGTYQEAILSPDLMTATGVVVDETSNKAYVLSGSLVYEVEL